MIHRRFRRDNIDVTTNPIYEKLMDSATSSMQEAYSHREDYTIEDISSLIYEFDELKGEDLFYKIYDSLESVGTDMYLVDKFNDFLEKNNISVEDGFKPLVEELSQFADDLTTNWGGRGGTYDSKRKSKRDSYNYAYGKSPAFKKIMEAVALVSIHRDGTVDASDTQYNFFDAYSGNEEEWEDWFYNQNWKKIKVFDYGRPSFIYVTRDNDSNGEYKNFDEFLDDWGLELA